MRALEFITGHVIYNPAYTYKFQLKTTIIVCQSDIWTIELIFVSVVIFHHINAHTIGIQTSITTDYFSISCICMGNAIMKS